MSYKITIKRPKLFLDLKLIPVGNLFMCDTGSVYLRTEVGIVNLSHRTAKCDHRYLSDSALLGYEPLRIVTDLGPLTVVFE